MQFRIFAVAAFLGLSSVSTAAPTLERRDNFGDATFYSPGLGACGTTNSATDLIGAVNAAFFKCGQQIRLIRDSKSVIVTIVDLCPGCAQGDVDLSPAAFSQLATSSEGRVKVTWEYVY
ncbi:hypothetical protein RUND412_006749 [Rhizina undulata]